MSVASQQSEPETYACSHQHCSVEFDRGDAVHGSYCSLTCYYREQGAGLLEKIASDPDHCATCFRPTRHGPVDLEAFHRTCLDAIAGRTNGPACGACYLAFARHRHLYESGSGVKAVRAEGTDQAHRPVYRYDWGCVCGTTDPNETHRFLQTEGKFVNERVNALHRALKRLSEKGAIDGPPDLEAHRAAKRERPTDWKYQAGASVYGSEG